MVKNLPFNAGDTGSIPSERTKVPHATRQLNPRTTARESTTREKCVPSKKDWGSQINKLF